MTGSAIVAADWLCAHSWLAHQYGTDRREFPPCVWMKNRGQLACGRALWVGSVSVAVCSRSVCILRRLVRSTRHRMDTTWVFLFPPSGTGYADSNTPIVERRVAWIIQMKLSVRYLSPYPGHTSRLHRCCHSAERWHETQQIRCWVAHFLRTYDRQWTWYGRVSLWANITESQDAISTRYRPLYLRQIMRRQRTAHLIRIHQRLRSGARHLIPMRWWRFPICS